MIASIIMFVRNCRRILLDNDVFRLGSSVTVCEQLYNRPMLNVVYLKLLKSADFFPTERQRFFWGREEGERSV